MKFVVISRRKDAFLMLSAERQMEIMEGMVAFVEKYRKAGKCKEIYFDADLKGGVSIWDADSDAESTQFILENPLAPFTDIDIRPIIEWDVGTKAVRQASQRQTKK